MQTTIKMKFKPIVLILIILLSRCSFAQDIFIKGNIRKSDCQQIKLLIATIKNNANPKSINLFYNDSKVPFYSYKKNGRTASDNILDKRLNDIVESNTTIIAPSKSEIEKSLLDIPLLYKRKKKIILYNRKGEYTPPYNFNDFNKLIDYIKEPENKKEKFVFLLILTKDKPIIRITSPKITQSVNYSVKVEGISEGSEPISEILVRVNKGWWQKANGTINWDLGIAIEKGVKNTIEAIAIDKMNDSSEIAMINDILYVPKNISSLSINYLDPQKYDVVQKCINNFFEHYNFKFTVYDPDLQFDNIQIVIENSKEVIMRKSMKDLLKNDNHCISGHKISDNRMDYCLYIVYSDLGFDGPCLIDESDNYYYYFTYEGSEIKTDKILIHFQSFKTNKETPCDCK